MEPRGSGRRILMGVFGDTKGKTILAIAAGASLLSFVADGFYVLFEALIQQACDWTGLSPWPAALVIVVAAGLLLWLLILYAQGQAREIAQRDRINPLSHPPHGAKGMILYLSPLRENYQEALRRWMDESEPGTPFPPEWDWHREEEVVNGAGLEGAPWAMAYQGLYPHQDTLEEVVVIPSADSQNSKGGIQPGTHAQFPLFCEFLEHCFPALQGRIRPLSQFLEEDESWIGGVPYSNLKHLIRVTDKVFDALSRDSRIGRETGRVLVDVTSGSRETGMAGTLVTLARDRRFQHVNTVNQEVRTFDIEYVAEGEGE